MKKILFIDDNLDFVKTFCGIVESKGYEIRSGKNFRETFASLGKSTFIPSVVVLDYSLVEDNLLEISASIKKKYTGCRIVMTTGRIDVKEIINKLLKRNIIDKYLPKPYTSKSLLRLIED